MDERVAVEKTARLGLMVSVLALNPKFVNFDSNQFFRESINSALKRVYDNIYGGIWGELILWGNEPIRWRLRDEMTGEILDTQNYRIFVDYIRRKIAKRFNGDYNALCACIEISEILDECKPERISSDFQEPDKILIARLYNRLLGDFSPYIQKVRKFRESLENDEDPRQSEEHKRFKTGALSFKKIDDAESDDKAQFMSLEQFAESVSNLKLIENCNVQSILELALECHITLSFYGRKDRSIIYEAADTSEIAEAFLNGEEYALSHLAAAYGYDSMIDSNLGDEPVKVTLDDLYIHIAEIHKIPKPKHWRKEKHLAIKPAFENQLELRPLVNLISSLGFDNNFDGFVESKQFRDAVNNDMPIYIYLEELHTNENEITFDHIETEHFSYKGFYKLSYIDRLGQYYGKKHLKTIYKGVYGEVGVYDAEGVHYRVALDHQNFDWTQGAKDRLYISRLDYEAIAPSIKTSTKELITEKVQDRTLDKNNENRSLARRVTDKMGAGSTCREAFRDFLIHYVDTKEVFPATYTELIDLAITSRLGKYANLEYVGKGDNRKLVWSCYSDDKKAPADECSIRQTRNNFNKMKALLKRYGN